MSRNVFATIRLDTRKFDEAMRNLARATQSASKAFEKAGAEIARILGRLLPDLQSRRDPRMRYGARNLAGDGTWLSEICATWLHDGCQLPGACDCRCHR